MDPLIKSQLLYQLSYAPFCKDFKHLAAVIKCGLGALKRKPPNPERPSAVGYSPLAPTGQGAADAPPLTTNQRFEPDGRGGVGVRGWGLLGGGGGGREEIWD